MLAKLGFLVVRTGAKYVGKTVKQSVMDHPRLAEGCTLLGQATHRVTASMSILAAGNTNLHVRPLDPALALDRGAEFIGEAFVVGVAGTCIAIEYTRTKRKSAESERKQEEREAERDRQIMEHLERINDQLGALQSQVNDLEREVQRAKSAGEGHGRAEGSHTTPPPPPLPPDAERHRRRPWWALW